LLAAPTERRGSRFAATTTRVEGQMPPKESRMKFPFPSFLVFALAAVAAVPAQDTCPMQTTKAVPMNIQYGPPQDCGGVSVQIEDIRLDTGRARCPLFVVVTPPHNTVAPSTQRTQVQVSAQLPITTTTFVCATRWLLIVPVGSQCIADKHFNAGFVQDWVTVACPPLPGS